MRDILIYFAIKYHGDYRLMVNAIKEKEKVDEEELNKIRKKNYQVLTILDDDYPFELKSVYMPPLVLFYKGDISLINGKNKLAVIGSRKPSEYGINATNKILDELFLQCEAIIVSGMAAGIDSIAHLSSLNHKMKTIAILGCGIDYCYPSENLMLKKEIEKNGLVLSEYPGNTIPNKNFFHLRNRIIAGISKAVLVTDAKIKSGTQITVRFALEQGKEIYAIPHSIFDNSFCNELIKQGAIPVLKGQDLEEFY